ncbi:ABC transporter permease [Bacteroidota bacterium]
MIKHLIKFSFRRISRDLVFSIINIAGLSIGLAISFIILIYVTYSLSFDRYNKNHPNIYRVVRNYVEKSRIQNQDTYPIAEKFKEEVPDFKEVITISGFVKYFIDFPEYVNKEKVFSVDKNIFNVFSIDLLYGNKNTALNDPFSIILSEEAAKKYFGEIFPMGQIIPVKFREKEYNLTVTGILKKIPKTSTFQPEMLLSKEIDINLKIIDIKDYYGSYCEIYVLLQKHHNIEDIENKLSEIPKRYLNKNDFKFQLENIRDIYLRSDNHLKNVRIFSIIGVLILMISCINYIITSLGRSSMRTKEIAIRKINGASRLRVIRQVLGESVLISFIAFPSALVLVELILPFANQMFKVELILNYFEMPGYILGMLIITLIVGVFSGGYIALFLSRLQPEKILKQKFNIKKSGNYFGKSLIIFQIGIFTTLLFSSLVIYKQISLAKNFDHKINADNVLIMYNSFYDNNKRHINNFDNIYPTIIDEIKQNPNIIDVAASYASPFLGFGIHDNYNPPNNPLQKIEIEFITITTPNFTELMEFEFIEGRGFNENFAQDLNSIILNEEAVRLLGLNNPVGSIINYQNRDGIINEEVIGVIKNFHTRSIYEKIQPLVIKPTKRILDIFIRYKPDKIKEVLVFIEKIWKKYVPGGPPYEPSFLSDRIKNSVNNSVSSDEKFSKNIMIFTLIAIFLAALGLFGFSLFISQQKTKEIGIRKALGASVLGINKFISKQFIILALIANAIAIPIAWILMDKWLQDFAYKIHIWPFIVLLSIIISIVIVILTININIIRAARKNPVDTLRYE